MRAKNVIAAVVCLLLASSMFVQKRNIIEKEEFRKYSANPYITKVQTPMLFIPGEADYRTTPTDFFRALKVQAHRYGEGAV